MVVVMKGVRMPLRKMKQKKFAGIYEYYRSRDPDKAVVAYYINVREPGGKPKKIKTEAKTPEEAAILLKQYRMQKPRTLTVNSEDINLTFHQVAQKFFTTRNTANNERDQRRYELHIKPILGSLKISSIKKRHMLKLQEEVASKMIPVSKAPGAPLVPISPKTVNNITDLAYRIMQWAFDRELVDHQIPRIEKLKVDNERQRVLSEPELELLFNSVEGETRIFLLLLYHTAQRPESILRLQRKHIINGMILVEGIKGQGSHIVPISRKLEEELDPWISMLDPDDFIISRTPERMSYETLASRMKKIFRRLFNQGLDYKRDAKQWVSLYTLRHTALTHIYERTGDIYAAQSIANHSSLRMTQRYAKRSEKLKLNAVNVL